MSKILIIEDEEAIAELEKDYLELNGFEVVVENNGLKGLETALAHEFDMYIIDLMLPEMDGLEICERIRKESDKPILLVTAKKDEIDKIRGFGTGADDYITKPFSPSELVARAKAHLARYERLTGENVSKRESFEIRGIKVDKTSRQVWMNGEEIFLTIKEFDMLVFFMEHPNQVFSKDDLFEHVWGMDSVGDISTVAVHVNRLREKIEIDTSMPQYIETVWGMGYRFKV